MSATTFSGPVRSEGGFQTVTKNATTGAITTTSTLGPATSVTSIAAVTANVSGNATLSGTANVIIIPTVDPAVAGAIWNDAGTLKVSAGA